MAWQHEWTDRLESRAAQLPACRSLRVYGSVATGELDRWSDLDVELIIDGPLTLAELAPWLRIWAYEEQVGDDQVLRMFDVDGHHLDLVVRGTALTGLPALDPVVNDVRFRLALAAVKLGRGDRLIGTHLGLGVAETVLVEAMLLRDADTGTTVHRAGTERDGVAERVLAAISQPFSPSSLIALFDELHSERDPRYRPDWRALSALGVANVPDVGHFRHT